MAQDPLTKEDILERFLITSMYTVSGGWPHGTGGTVVACKISCTDEDDNEWVSHQVYRNDRKHAEIKLLKYLKSNSLVKNSKEIKIKVYQNYSPCSDCAKKIMKYMKEERRNENRKVEMTITFANFYNTHVYKNNTQEQADANILGLIGLYGQPEVKFELLGVHVKWERFLDMSEFFRLTEDEKNGCLNKADSQERKRREVQDQLVWGDIFDEITSKLDRSRISQLRDELQMQIENREAEDEEFLDRNVWVQDLVSQIARLSAH